MFIAYLTFFASLMLIIPFIHATYRPVKAESARSPEMAAHSERATNLAIISVILVFAASVTVLYYERSFAYSISLPVISMIWFGLLSWLFNKHYSRAPS